MAKKQEEEEAPTNAEKFAAFIDGLVANQTISADVGAIIKHAIDAKKDKL